MDAIDETDIAIVGMALRVPGANTPERFWRNLREGVESVRFLDDDELRAAGVPPEEWSAPGYVRASAELDDVPGFDADFFGFAPQDAAITDPQHRHFLEVCWEALESAGRPPSRFAGPAGVFGGCGLESYLFDHVLRRRELAETLGRGELRHTGNDKDFLATRVSYEFDLHGPSVGVQTACSTSLVATHLACQSLLARECDLALAGGSTIVLPHGHGYRYRDGELQSPDGHCRPFDARAGGTIFGSGVAVVALRRLSDALADGDPVRAVIKGSAVNNDGAGKVSFLAPSVDGQAAAVAEALEVAGVAPHEVDYVEAHGTGTRVGDPIEVAALTQAFGSGPRAMDRPCWLGSVKANVGHLDTAAGVAGLIKAALALERGELPPALHWSGPNPEIDFAAGPFRVNEARQPWPEGAGPRRAAVNSLGVGGTNAFAVLEQAPGVTPATNARELHLLQWSARDRGALDEGAARLAEHLRAHPDVALADVAWTLERGRHDFPERRVLACRSVEEAASLLEAGDPRHVPTHRATESPPVAAFLFPGGGAPLAGCGAALARAHAPFREVWERGLALARERHGLDLEAAFSRTGTQTAQEDPARQLPALFVLEVALARTWQALGVQPRALLGHSLGEITAAHVSGVMSFEEALALAVVRGRLFAQLPPGGMLSVALPAGELRPLLGDALDLAVENAPELSVASGPRAELEALEQRLRARGVDAQRIPIAVAAHSRALDGILDDYRAQLAGMTLSPPEIPFLSNRSGKWIEPGEACDPDYWVAQMRHTVRYAACAARLLDELPQAVLVEAGPGATLGALAQAQPQWAPGHHAVSSLPPADDARADEEAWFLTALGRTWAAGADFDRERLWDGERGRRIPLPTYAFQHKRYWIEPDETATAGAARDALPVIRRRAQFERFLTVPGWEEIPAPAAADPQPRRWLVFVDEEGVGEALVRRLREAGADVTQVRHAEYNERVAADEYRVDSDRGAEGFEMLVEGLARDERLPERIVHLWGLTGGESRRTALNRFAHHVEWGFYSPFHLLQRLAERDALDGVHALCVTNGARSVHGEELAAPEKAMVDGLALCLPYESPGFSCTLLDLDFGSPGGPRVAEAVAQVEQEARARPDDVVIARRGGRRYRRRDDRLASLEEAPDGGRAPRGVRRGGTYLVTGGLGGVGLALAEALAERGPVHLLLVGRRGLPPRDEWARVRREGGAPASDLRAMRVIERLEDAGNEVMVGAVDVTDHEELRSFLDAAEQRCGPVRGVIHAAGTIRDALLPAKTMEEVEDVLAPKVYGTQVLDLLFHDRALDFFVLCSSTSALVGAPGQTDYVAANAFLSAFAHHRARRVGEHTVAVEWGAWSEVGMAAEALRGDERPLPWLARVEDDWRLAEHRLPNGSAVLPGTAYVDLAQEAWRELGVGGAFTVRELELLRPLRVEEGSPRHARLLLRRGEGGHLFSVQTHVADATGRTGWLTHARARLLPCGDEAPAPVDLDAVHRRCPREVEASTLVGGQERSMRFGPRWRVLEGARLGEDEALLRLRLPADYAADLEDHPLHPALLDAATAGALALIPGYDPEADVLWVPTGVDALHARADLQGELRSWVRLRGSDSGREGSAAEARFDATVCAPDGRVLVEVEGLRMRALAFAASLDREPPVAPSEIEADDSSGESASPAQRALRRQVERGLRQDEGRRALLLAIESFAGAELVVSALDPDDLREQARAAAAAASAAPRAEERFARPSLDVAFAEPENEDERALAEIWGELFGIDAVGAEDDFFALGGHSLLAVRLFARIRREWGVGLDLGAIFEAPTVRALAARLARVRGEDRGDGEGDAASGGSAGVATDGDAWTSLVPMRTEGSRPPFFCAAGKGGNPMNLRHLAARLPDEQPFYGIQHRGFDGRRPPYESLEEMARDCVRDVRRVQPDGPYLLGGFSAGGLVVFEMARQLREAGEEVGLLALFDTPNPRRGEIGRFGRLRIHGLELLRRGPGYLLDRARARADRRRREAEREDADGTPTVRGMDEARAQVAAAWNRMERDYVVRPLDLDAMLFRPYQAGREAGSRFLYGDAYNGWRPFLRDVEVVELPGGHGTMCEEPHVRIFARHLGRALERARGRAAARPA